METTKDRKSTSQIALKLEGKSSPVLKSWLYFLEGNSLISSAYSLSRTLSSSPSLLSRLSLALGPALSFLHLWHLVCFSHLDISFLQGLSSQLLIPQLGHTVLSGGRCSSWLMDSVTGLNFSPTYSFPAPLLNRHFHLSPQTHHLNGGENRAASVFPYYRPFPRMTWFLQQSRNRERTAED